MTGFKQKNKFGLKKGDFLLTALLFFASLGALFPVRRLVHHGNTATLYQDGQQVGTFSLQRNQIVPFDHFTIEVRNGAIAIIESDCPQKICVHTGAISNPAQTIVCVPNRILVEIASEKPSALNAVSY
jgi:hypothetical protein